MGAVTQAEGQPDHSPKAGDPVGFFSVATESSGLPGILQFMFVSHDRDEFRINARRRNESPGNLLHDPALLVARCAFLHPEDNHGLTTNLSSPWLAHH